MKQLIAALVSGALFGFGLAFAGMTNPANVLAFLDIFGDWSATLALVMGGALAVTVPLTYLVLRRQGPVFADVFHLPSRFSIDKKLVLGAVLFGLGWGIAGLCPGPAIATLVTGSLDSLLFVIAMFVGLKVADLLAAKI